MKADKLRRRESIHTNRNVSDKIGQNKKYLLMIHDIYTFGYIGIILIMASFNIAPFLSCFLLLIDALWIHSDNRFHKSYFPTLYTVGCVLSALMALSSQYKFYVFAYQMHCFSRLISPIYIIHRRNKKYSILEWLYVLSWLVMKVGASWSVLILYWNEAGKLYSDWVISQYSTPIYNPWTNPPAILLVVVAVANVVVECVQSYYVVMGSKSFI